MGYFIAIIAIMGGFGIPLSAIWGHHQQKMMELKLKLSGAGDNNLRAEIDALRQEMRALRDTTMQYDLSFDTALQRVEGRVESVESRVRTVESSQLAQVGSQR